MTEPLDMQGSFVPGTMASFFFLFLFFFRFAFVHPLDRAHAEWGGCQCAVLWWGRYRIPDEWADEQAAPTYPPMIPAYVNTSASAPPPFPPSPSV